MKKCPQLSVSLDNRLVAALRRKAADLEISLSALCAAYVEKGLYDESTARLIEQLEDLVKRLNEIYPSDGINSSINASDPSSKPVTPLEYRAFMLEVLLYLRAFTKNDVGMRGDIAAQVKKYYGDNRVKGL